MLINLFKSRMKVKSFRYWDKMSPDSFKFLISDSSMTKSSQFSIINHTMITLTSPFLNIKWPFKTLSICLTNSSKMFIPDSFHFLLWQHSICYQFIWIQIINGWSFVDVLIHHWLSKSNIKYICTQVDLVHYVRIFDIQWYRQRCPSWIFGDNPQQRLWRD